MNTTATHATDRVAKTPQELAKQPHWVIAAIVLVIVAIALLFIVDRLFNPQQFQIKQIEVYGRLHQVDGMQVKQIVESALEGNYFSVSLQRLENKIKQIPWVFSVSLRRQWPSTIVVYVTEVQPISHWGDEQWLNVSGDLVARQPGNHNENLPLLSGADEQAEVVWEAFRHWSERFASSGISLEALRLDARGLWWLKLSLGALVLNGGQSAQVSRAQGEAIEQPFQVTMVVDKTHSFSRVERFIEALNQKLIIQFPHMERIDLRYPNGFAISWRGSQPIAQSLATLESDY